MVLSYFKTAILELATEMYVRKSNNKYNWLFSTFFNFKFLPWKEAIKYPIIFYGNPKIIALSNIKITIDTDNVYRGMIEINKTNESACNSGGDTELMLKGKKITFKGKALIGTGCRIMSYGSSEIEFGNNIIINNQNNIGSAYKLTICDDVVIGHQNQIFDTNFHFMYNSDRHSVKCQYAETIIGKGSWIANRVTIQKGVTLPPYTIVSSNSLITKNLTAESATIWGGIPATILSNDHFYPIFSNYEADMYNYFSSNQDCCENLQIDIAKLVFRG